MKTSLLSAGFLSLLTLATPACQPRVPQSRPPTDREAETEKTLAPAPAAEWWISRATPSPAAGPAQPASYQVWTRRSEDRPYAVLATTGEAASPTFVPRAASSAIVAGQLFEALLSGPGTTPALDAKTLHLRATTLAASAADETAQTATVLHVPLPLPCTQTGPALLQADGDKIQALLRCPREGHALLLTLDGQGQVVRSRRVPAAADATLFLHQPDGDYLAVARQVLRVPDAPADALPVIGTVPPPGGDGDTRELLRRGDTLLIVDGAAGRVIGMDAGRMGWRFEKRFYSQGTVVRLRSLWLTADRLWVVTAEETPTGRELFATQISLSDTSSQPPLRLALGAVAATGHELLPLAESAGGGALLLYSVSSASGLSLRSRRLAP